MSEAPKESPSVPQISEEQQAVQILVNLAARRQRSSVLSKNELQLIIADLMKNFINSSTLRTAPTKSQMLVAVSALLQTPGNVSSKWSKPQLAEVLMRWINEASSLSPPSLQSKLFVQMKSFKVRQAQKRRPLRRNIYRRGRWIRRGILDILTGCPPAHLDAPQPFATPRRL